MIRWCFDLDNTLVKTKGTNYKESVPIDAAVKKVREYYDRGDHIIIMTARGASSKKDWRQFTAEQLKDFSIPYHQLSVGLKPSDVDFFVDDKAVNSLEWLDDEERALSRVETLEESLKERYEQ
jgi:hypothetical protein